MTNEEYQQQARERRYQEEREAEQRRSMDELNRRQREQQARADEESRRAYSRRLGQIGGLPSIFGPGDNARSFSVALGDVRRTDKNGIETLAGRKYHFDRIPGGNKVQVEELFEEWLFRTHLVEIRAQ